jgi:hypothetical protein
LTFVSFIVRKRAVLECHLFKSEILFRFGMSHSSNEDCGGWARIERLVTGRDGNVRGAQVLRVKNGKRNLINRPLQKLYPLEIRCANTDEDVETKVRLVCLNEQHPGGLQQLLLTTGLASISRTNRTHWQMGRVYKFE